MLVLSGGEPLMRRDIWEIAAHGTQLGLRMCMATNGMLVDDQVCAHMKETGIRMVSLSLDGATAATLRLRPDVPGASMWAVALERTMLTYFEIEPRSRFQTHSHASEQITMVLDGELFFEVAGGMEVLVRAGEVIAIPANAPHAAWTGDRRARAVDSWSPVRLDFIR